MSIDLNNLDLNAFDFNQIEKQTGVNPFEQDKKSYVDERFYTLTKDKDMKGQAIIAFLPLMLQLKSQKIKNVINQSGPLRVLDLQIRSMKLMFQCGKRIPMLQENINLKRDLLQI